MLLWDYEKEGYYTYKLIANDDACEECEKLNGKELSIKEFSENEFFPLIHPNCKCEIQILNEKGNEVATVTQNILQEEKVSLLDQISNFLAVASFIPGFDTFTNFASIPVDLLRGDFLSAGLDVIGVIPFIGEAADIAKTINKADDIADIVKLANKADDASDVGKAIDKVDDIEDIKKIKYPGNDPSKSPGSGFEWRGRSKPSEGKGNWYNPTTGEKWNSDLNHSDPIGPHWDYTNKNGKSFRIYPDGHIEKK